MPTRYIDPNADLVLTSFAPDTGSTVWDKLDDAVRQPTAPTTGSDHMLGKAGATGEWLGDNTTYTLVAGETVTQAKVWAYGVRDNDATITVQLRKADNTVLASSGEVACSGWISATYNGALTQAEIDGLRIDISNNDLNNGLLYVAASYIELTTTIDTTPPASPTFAVAGGAATITARATTGNFSTSDSPTTGYQIKIWGDVDTASDANIQATEGASSWVAYTTSKAVVVSTGDGTKNLHAKIRDAAGNETAQLDDSVVLDTTAPQSPTLAVAAGAPIVNSQVTTADLSTSDTPTTGYQIKIWGNVDTSYDANVQATEGASSWVAYTTSKAIKLASGDGVKTINARIRDQNSIQTAILTDTVRLTANPVVVNIDSITTGDAVPTSTPHKISDKATKDTATVVFTTTAGGTIRKWVMRYEPTNRNTGQKLGGLGVVCGSGDRCGTPSAKLLGMASGHQITETVTRPETGPGSDGGHNVQIYAMTDEQGWNDGNWS